MHLLDSTADIERALSAVGELLHRGGSHVHDLIALTPADDELDEAAVWVKGQDANTREFPTIVDDVVRYVRSRRDAAHR